MDLKPDKRSDSESTKRSNPSSQIKTCSDCHTTRTPLWRGGPAGPKSLCNACGIKYNKKRRELLGLDKGKNEKGKKKRKQHSSSSSNNNNSGSSKSSELSHSLKMRLMALGTDMLLHRSDKLMNKLREEEQAAILLMAISCGSVYA